MSSNLTEQAKKLPVDERIALVEEIWDSIAEDNGCFELTEAQKQEIDRTDLAGGPRLVWTSAPT